MEFEGSPWVIDTDRGVEDLLEPHLDKHNTDHLATKLVPVLDLEGEVHV
jgi:hypothetical protein